MNNDSISTLKIVKAGDLLEVEAHATLQQADWENFLNATQKNEKGNYEVWFQYFGSNTGEEEHTFDAIVEVAVKNITKVAAAKKSMREDGITKGNIIHRN